MKLKFRDFNGLMTNIDASDKPAEYFSKFKDIKVYPGYIESKGLSFQEQAYGIPIGHTFIEQQYVFLDEDKYQNIKVGGNGTEFTVEPINDGLQVQGAETSNEEHHYFIKITRNDETGCFFEWHIDNQEPGEEIPISTTEFIPLINGLKIKFSRKYNRGKLWRVQSHITNVTELKNNYIQNIQKYLFQITYLNGNYHFYIDNIEVTNSPFADEANQYPKIINEQGVLKILMKKKALWIGKIKRHYWAYNYVGQIDKAFYLYPLIEDYKGDNLSLFNFEVKNSADSEILECYARVDNEVYTLDYIGLSFNVVAVRFYRKDDLYPINFGGSNYVIFYKVRFSDNGKTYYILWKGYAPDLFTPDPGIQPRQMGGSTKFLLSNGNWERVQAIENEYFYMFGDIESVRQYMTDSIQPNIMGTKIFNVDLIKANITSSSSAFDSGRDIEVLTTLYINGSEYPIYYTPLEASTTSSFFIKVTPNPDRILELYKNKITANIYFRYSSDATDAEDKDFELCYTVNFLSEEMEYFPKYIDKTIPNGIFLTQMIGKFFDPLTYKIITAFDDYSNVAGVPYILKNSNVHFPAVGGGSILNNFYYENVVPGIEGKQLVAFANLLGVFSATQELMTLIDFSPVESSMIFYIKDTLGYKVRDINDIIETAEGTFIHLKEGIFITNGRERTLISEQINNLVRLNYKNASIFYNSFWKQLYYYTGRNLYCFDFETKSWCEYSLPKEFDRDELKDFIEDYEGATYFITKRVSYKLEYESKVGELELSYLDLQEYSISKRINYLVADHIGSIEASNISVANGNSRAIRYLFNKLENRKPIKDISVLIKFNGTLYGIEMDIETIRTDQL